MQISNGRKRFCTNFKDDRDDMFQISKVVFNTGGKEGNMFGLPNASCIYMNEKI